MRRRTIATVLNFVVPGTGLWYLGKVGFGCLNFLIALLVPALALYFGGEHAHYIFLAIAAGSAGFAHALATRTHRLQTAGETRATDSVESR
ncbi:MAG: hypothetical protein KDA81_11010 [Planctomycetaceae bacterium]|nr:hypothetical protein [Planctomycetaceae bacterium]